MDFAIIISNIDKYGDTYSEILFVQNTWGYVSANVSKVLTIM